MGKKRGQFEGNRIHKNVLVIPNHQCKHSLRYHTPTRNENPISAQEEGAQHTQTRLSSFLHSQDPHLGRFMLPFPCLCQLQHESRREPKNIKFKPKSSQQAKITPKGLAQSTRIPPLAAQKWFWSSFGAVLSSFGAVWGQFSPVSHQFACSLPRSVLSHVQH